jgi:hypothetical protein
MVREVGRSAHLASQVEDIGQGFARDPAGDRAGPGEGVVPRGARPALASWVVYGGLEEILTGWVMGRLPDGDEEVARAERTIVDVVSAASRTAPSSPEAARRDTLVSGRARSASPGR